MKLDPFHPAPPAIPGQVVVPDQLTPLSLLEAASALAAAYSHVFEDELGRQALCCLLAQTALETGRWKLIHRNNWGNIKGSDSYRGTVTYFRCNEVIDGRTEWFDPYNLQCRFRAPPTAPAGAEQYVRFLGTATRGSGRPNRYQHAWDAAMAGDVDGFVDELSTAHYFTANVDRYRAGCKALFVEFLRDLPSVLPDAPHVHDPIILQPTEGHSRTSDEDLAERIRHLQIPLTVDWNELNAARDAAVRSS